MSVAFILPGLMLFLLNMLILSQHRVIEQRRRAMRLLAIGHGGRLMSVTSTLNLATINPGPMRGTVVGDGVLEPLGPHGRFNSMHFGIGSSLSSGWSGVRERLSRHSNLEATPGHDCVVYRGRNNNMGEEDELGESVARSETLLFGRSVQQKEDRRRNAERGDCLPGDERQNSLTRNENSLNNANEMDCCVPITQRNDRLEPDGCVLEERLLRDSEENKAVSDQRYSTHAETRCETHVAASISTINDGLDKYKQACIGECKEINVPQQEFVVAGSGNAPTSLTLDSSFYKKITYGSINTKQGPYVHLDTNCSMNRGTPFKQNTDNRTADPDSGAGPTPSSYLLNPLYNINISGSFFKLPSGSQRGPDEQKEPNPKSQESANLSPSSVSFKIIEQRTLTGAEEEAKNYSESYQDKTGPGGRARLLSFAEALSELGNQTPGEGKNSTLDKVRGGQSVLAVVLLASLTFFILQTPFVVWSLWGFQVFPDSNRGHAWRILSYSVATMLLNTTHAVNCLVYCVLGVRFRQELIKVVNQSASVKSRRNTHHEYM
ncbi:uncharacterized protein LOC101847853 [Aplysia californica]|uniref:Uncharacterized protein LOC101847853 n=1 Tax=Aplysia californica TaxID=6500 RepID=A0ABM0JCN3_APLCA|nr:uncharacterized protein LOC101847853 [Aplysia californica]